MKSTSLTSTDNRDNSIHAMINRFRKANMNAIASHNAITFDSLRDIFFLIQKRSKEEELQIKIEILEERIDALTDELRFGKNEK